MLSYLAGRLLGAIFNMLVLSAIFMLVAVFMPYLERRVAPPVISIDIPSDNFSCVGSDVHFFGSLEKVAYLWGVTHELASMEIRTASGPVKWIDTTRPDDKLISRAGGPQTLGTKAFPLIAYGACGEAISIHVRHDSLAGWWSVHSGFGWFGADQDDQRQGALY